LWDVESGCNTLVNFETVRLQASKPIQLATSQDPALVFVPCMTAVKVIILYIGFSLFNLISMEDISTALCKP
jgi:DNA excision repair protein ERCC-8